jgi:hypothetical protein
MPQDTTYHSNQAHIRTQLQFTIRSLLLLDIRHKACNHILMETMQYLSMDHRIVRRLHTPQANSAFHTNLLARNPPVCQARINSKGNNTPIPHNRSIRFMLHNMLSHHHRKLDLCYRLSKSPHKTHHVSILRQAQHRIILKSPRPLAIDSSPSLAERMYRLQALVGQVCLLCIR